MEQNELDAWFEWQKVKLPVQGTEANKKSVTEQIISTMCDLFDGMNLYFMSAFVNHNEEADWTMTWANVIFKQHPEVQEKLRAQAEARAQPLR